MRPWAIWRRSLAGGKSRVSVAADPGRAALVSRSGKALLWTAHPTCGSALPPHGTEPSGSAGGAPQPPQGAAPLTGVHPSQGCSGCCAPLTGTLLWIPVGQLLCGVLGQGSQGSQQPFYQPGAAGTAFLGCPWVLRLRSAPLSSRGEPRAALLTAGCRGLAPRDKVM